MTLVIIKLLLFLTIQRIGSFANNSNLRISTVYEETTWVSVKKFLKFWNLIPGVFLEVFCFFSMFSSLFFNQSTFTLGENEIAWLFKERNRTFYWEFKNNTVTTCNSNSVALTFRSRSGQEYAFFNWIIVNTQCYLSFMCTTQWLESSVLHALLTTNVATICHHTTFLQQHWLYSLSCAFYSCDCFIP